MGDTTRQWIYRIVPARPGMPADPTPEEVALAQAHFAYLVELKERGILVLAGRTQEDDPVGIAIFDAPDEPVARALMDADPAIAGGLFLATLHPYSVAVARDSLS
ncbi:YciI family protein [Microbacterium ulmi]|uniref:YCII-related domain-containing protein n=1 Tax=Microbacterium ulmi TaxID=179095 RepID=A0A7Y2LX77_9MICO|nr:YciI family protein [Microbacterium ulmi]NII71191.1 uncharacterized protein YciI [Microbacterium ulmi]NNH02496.1 hypothetical protein [Microbacterium ulmi]